MGNRQQAELFFNNAVATVNDRSRPEYLQHAFQMFASAMNVDPTFADAAYQAGNACSDLLQLPAAVACWRRALECEMPDRVPKESTAVSRAKVLTNLGWRLECLGQTEHADVLLGHALLLDPELSFAWLNRSICQARLGHTAWAVESARKAHALAPDDPTVEMGLSFALLFDRQFAEGFKHFECRFKYRLYNFTKYPWPRWDGEPDKVVFLVSDQGLGDTLSMARFVRETCRRSRYVHAYVHPELLLLFQNVFGDIKNLNLVPQPAAFPECEAWTTFVSLPRALGLSDDEIRTAPQISYQAPRTNTSFWKVPDRKLHIGIAWRGSSLNEINQHRSIPVTQFLDLARVPGVQLYSLQVDENKQQMFDSGCAPIIKDLSGYVRNVCDTLSLLRDLDLVVTCESALGHICAMAGIETWIPYSYLGRDYRIGVDGSDQLWSKHRVFSQGNDLRWQPVFDDICAALEEKVR